MKNVFYFLLVLVFCISFDASALTREVQSQTKPPTQIDQKTDVSAFKQSMQQAMEDQKNKIKKLRAVVFNLKAPVVEGAGDELINDTVMFEVKQSLYNNFIDSPTSQDPEFQSHLLRVMNQTKITEDDLKDLQRAAEEARARLRK